MARLHTRLILLGGAALAAAPGQDASGGTAAPFPSPSTVYRNIPWPLPKKMSVGTDSVVLPTQPTLSCGSKADGCDPAACTGNTTLSRAVARYAAILSPPGAPAPGPNEAALAGQIEVCVGNAAEPLGPEMNETHSLYVPGGGTAANGQQIRIEAFSQHGALRALESLAHLVSIVQPGRIVNAPVQINDSPRWGTRGDSSPKSRLLD